MSEEQLRKLRSDSNEGHQLTADDLAGPAGQYEKAVAIDPGVMSGLAWTGGSRIYAWRSRFWQIAGDTPFLDRPDRLWGLLDPSETAIILEAPFLSRPGMAANNTAKAYNSGRVAREAELLDARLTGCGYDVSRFDPAKYKTGKWDQRTTEHMAGEWAGPNNDDVRDAIRLLVFYDFI